MSQFQRVKIPLKKSDVSIEALEPYIKDIYDIFISNQFALNSMYEVYENQHNVLTKKRTFDSDSKVNNIVIEPHLYSMINFKTGFCCGNPKEYALLGDDNIDDITEFNKFWLSSNGRSIDDAVTEWVYAVGVGYYFIQASDDTDSPYRLYCVDPRNAIKVYSSFIDEEPLCDIIVNCYTQKSKEHGNEDIIELQIYTENEQATFKYKSNISIPLNATKADRATHILPLVEKYANPSRMGIVEIGKTLNDAIDRISSSAVDNIEDNANKLYVFINAVLGQTPEESSDNFAAMKENGVIVLTSRMNIPADFKIVDTALDYDKLDNMRESLREVLYDTCGVPLQSKAVGSGNNGASENGTGWTNAYTVMLKDINYMLIADRDLIKKILYICHEYNRVVNLEAANIDIRYKINRSDNLLVKAQSYDYFSKNNVPPAIATRWCEITNDPETDARAIEEHINEILQEQKENEARKANITV